MKNLILITALLFAQTSFAATLTIRFKGFTKMEGTMRWAAYVPGSQWPDEGHSAFGSHFSVSESEHIIKVDNVPYGTYALVGYHDINNNDKMDKNFLGIPKEPFGFSNGVRPKLSAPSYDSAKFEFTSESQIIDLEVKGF